MVSFQPVPQFLIHERPFSPLRVYRTTVLRREVRKTSWEFTIYTGASYVTQFEDSSKLRPVLQYRIKAPSTRENFQFAYVDVKR